jgi:hypothetical protein
MNTLVAIPSVTRLDNLPAGRSGRSAPLRGYGLNAISGKRSKRSGGGYGEVGAHDPSTNPRDRMMGHVGEAVDG